MESVIRLITQKRETSLLWMPDRYEFNPKGRMPWLQRLLFKLLRRLKADSYDQIATYSTVSVDTKKILDALMQNRRDVEMIWNQKAKYVVMGPADFYRFTNEAYSDQNLSYLQFEMTATLGRGMERKILGLRCVVVPWIEGFCVLPELNGSGAQLNFPSER